MQFQQIYNRDDAHAHHCPNWVGPKAGLPELPAGFPQPPAQRACSGGRRGLVTASIDVDNAKLARDALCKRLDDYKLEAVLGNGAFGRVYQAMDISHREYGKKVAIKQIPRACVTGDSREMLFTEKRILSDLTLLNSPYFTPLIESFMDPHNFIIIQGLAAGGSLRGAMSNAKKLFRMHEIKFIMAQLCYAVGTLHDQAVVHRDLKPDNVFMDEHGRLVIGDFGLGHVFKGHKVSIDEVLTCDDYWHRTSGKCGTPGYIAPEMLRGDHYSYKVDSFSVGVMFYELVFGRLPFRGRDRKDLEDNTLYGDAFIPRWFRKRYPAACNLMRRLLAKNPDHRIAMQDTLQSRYFRGVNWDRVEKKTQPVPAGWKTAPHRVQQGAYLSMCVLVDDLKALTRWRADPAEYEFLAPLRWRPGKEYPACFSPILMSPQALSPDLREERLAVGLRVKEVLGRRSRQPQEFATVPLNEPIPSPTLQVKEEPRDIELVDIPSNNAHCPLPYDFPHPITDDGHHDPPAARQSLFSVCDRSIGSGKDFRSAFVDHDQEEVKKMTGFSLFDVSIVPVQEYKPSATNLNSSIFRKPESYPKLFFSYGLSESPVVKQEAAPFVMMSAPQCTHTTLAYTSSLSSLTPYRTPSNGDLTKPIDFPTLWRTLEGQGDDAAQQEDRIDQEPRSLTFLTPIFRKAVGPFEALDKLADLFDIPTALSS